MLHFFSKKKFWTLQTTPAPTPLWAHVLLYLCVFSRNKISKHRELPGASCKGTFERRAPSPAAAHSAFQSSNVLKHVKHRETAERPCMRMKRQRGAVQRNFTRVQALQKPRAPRETPCHHSVPSARSKPLQRVAKFTRRAR